MFMKTTVPIILFVLLISIANSISAATFKGKVIDADTREPIEGAVVVAVWSEETTTPTAIHSRLKDAKEVLTNKNGEWVIKGPKGRKGGSITAIFTFFTGTYYTKRPQFTIFKPGYCSCPLAVGMEVCKERMKPFSIDGEGETLELPKLTKRDRMTIIRNIPSLGIAGEADEKLPLFKKLIEREEKEIRR